MDTVYSLEVWVPDGERWHWSAIGAYPTLDMAVAVGEGFLSVKPYRVRRATASTTSLPRRSSPTP